MARVVFLGTPDYSIPSLEALIAHHEVVAVVTQPDRYGGRGRRKLQEQPAKKVARRYGLTVIQPKRLSRDDQALALLTALDADVFVLAAYGQILRRNVLSIPPHGVIGVHASLLPRWRGAAPVAAAIRAGDSETGVTLMRTEAGLDTGPTIAQRTTAIRSDDTRASLTARLAELGASLLIDTLPTWLRGEIVPLPQDDDQATYAPEINKSEGAIDWTAPARAIDRHIRAMTSWPGAFSRWERDRIKILSGRGLPRASAQGVPGTVIEKDQGIAVVTGDGLLLLDQIQPSGKRAMAARAFANGRRDFIGAVLT